MLNPEKLFTGPAFKPGVGGASTPPLDALQSSVDDHLGMDSELTCYFVPACSAVVHQKAGRQMNKGRCLQ